MINDLNNCTLAIFEKDIQECKKQYLYLIGKYGKMDGFPKTEDNPLYLSHHPDTYIDNLQIIQGFLELETSKLQTSHNNNALKSIDFSKVFIVHGHDEALKQEVARVIEKQGIEAVILHEQANQGATIIEKIEKNSAVGAAICLFTPDDRGKAKSEGNDKKRARQNVVFEAGYFMGKLGRDKVIFIADPSVEMPSDLQGVVYTDTKDWKIDLAKELDEIGYNIDFNKFFKR